MLKMLIAASGSMFIGCWSHFVTLKNTFSPEAKKSLDTFSELLLTSLAIIHLLGHGRLTNRAQSGR